MELDMRNLRELRASIELTQKELAERVNITRVYLAQLESNVYKPTTTLKNKIRDALLGAILQKLRPMLPFAQRLEETKEVVDKLTSSDDVAWRTRQRVLALRIDEPSVEPMVLNGVWALYLRDHDGMDKIDLIMLDDAEANLEQLLVALHLVKYES